MVGCTPTFRRILGSLVMLIGISTALIGASVVVNEAHAATQARVVRVVRQPDRRTIRERRVVRGPAVATVNRETWSGFSTVIRR
jgi:hypothetical protein